MTHQLMIVFALVLFIIAAGFPFGPPAEPYRLRLVAAGLAFWVAMLLF